MPGQPALLSVRARVTDLKADSANFRKESKAAVETKYAANASGRNRPIVVLQKRFRPVSGQRPQAAVG